MTLEREVFSRANDTRPKSPRSMKVSNELVRADRFAQRPGRLLHRLHDVLIAGAPAQVAGEPLANVALAGRGFRFQERVRRQHHAGRAISALQTMLIPEPLLDRAALPAPGQPFYGR